MRKFLLCIFLFPFSLNFLYAQLTAYPIKDGGRGSLLCSDSLMLFRDGSNYSKTIDEQSWHKRDSLGSWQGTYALDGVRIYRITSKDTGINTNIYSSEISVSNDRGVSWQNLVPSSKLGTEFYGLTFIAKDSTLYFSSQSGNIYKYNLVLDTFITLYAKPALSPIYAQQFKLSNNKIYFNFLDKIYVLDSINHLDTIVQIVNLGYVNGFEIDSNKIAIVTSQGNYFSNDSGLIWLPDSSAQYDTISTLYNNRLVAIHNGMFYSITSSYNTGNFKKHKATFSYSDDGIHWRRDSMFFYNLIWFSTIDGIQFSIDKIYLSTSNGVFQYDTLLKTFIEQNQGIKENKISEIATNKTYHVIKDRFSVRVRNLQSGIEDDITEFLPTLNDSQLLNFYYLKTSFSITQNNKIYYQIGSTDDNLFNDKLFVSADTGHTWSLVDTAVVIKYFATNDSLYYITNQKFYRSLNAGLTSTEISSFAHYGSFFSVEVKSEYAIQGNGRRLYIYSPQLSLGGGNPYHDYPTYFSTDFGLSWTYEFSFQEPPPQLNIGAQNDFIFSGGFYKKAHTDTTWNYLFDLPSSLNSYHSLWTPDYCFVRNNNQYIYAKPNSFPNSKTGIYLVDDSYNFAYPVFQTSLLNNLNVKVKSENEIVSLAPQVNSSYYYLYEDTAINFFGLASGKIFYDSNNNNLIDSLDAPFNGGIISNNLSSGISNSSGNFFIPLSQTTDTIYSFTNQKYTAISPLSLLAYPHDSTLNFLVTTIQGVNDLSIYTSMSSPPRPGFKQLKYLTCKNEGTTTQQFTVKYIKESGTTILNTNPLANTISGDTLIWGFFTLPSFQSFRISILDSVSITDTVGRILTSRATINSAAVDTFPANNISVFSMRVVNSVDPNEKSVEPEIFTSSNFNSNDFLTYTIQFQNTGTAIAFNVWVEDTLSPMLDITTFQAIASSTNYILNFRDENVISFWFYNLQLLDSNTSEPGSHGFVTFQIKPKSNWILGDSICNTAHIYFDYNDAVSTNSVCSILVQPNLSKEVSASINLSVFPNPAQNKIFIQSKQKLKSVRVFNAMAQVVISSLEDYSQGIDISALSDGIYFLELVDTKNTERVKFVKN